MRTTSNIIGAQRWRNLLHTAALFTGMLLLLLAVGYLLLGPIGLLWAAGLGGFVLLFGARVPSQLIMRLQGGRPLTSAQAPTLVRLITDISREAGLKRAPQLYYVPTRALNAFATGSRKDPAIALTYGLLHQLSLRELSGVLAHEIGHIVNNDIPLRTMVNLMDRMTRVLSFVGKVMLLFYLPMFLLGELAAPPWPAIALLIFAPAVSTLLALAFSRTREFEADLAAARITGDPGALADALRKLNFYNQGGWPALLSPVRRWNIPKFLRTHPSTRERVERLRQLIPRFSPRIDLERPPQYGAFFGIPQRSQVWWRF